jgi:hypothetical protein
VSVRLDCSSTGLFRLHFHFHIHHLSKLSCAVLAVLAPASFWSYIRKSPFLAFSPVFGRVRFGPRERHFSACARQSGIRGARITKTTLSRSGIFSTTTTFYILSSHCLVIRKQDVRMLFKLLETQIVSHSQIHAPLLAAQTANLESFLPTARIVYYYPSIVLAVKKE